MNPLKRPVPPPDTAPERMVFKRAVDGGKLRQEKFNYYYSYKWLERLGNKWTIHDVFIYLAINLSRFSRDFQGRDRDSIANRDAARNLRGIANVATRRADILDARADRLEGKDAETEAVD